MKNNKYIIIFATAFTIIAASTIISVFTSRASDNSQDSENDSCVAESENVATGADNRYKTNNKSPKQLNLSILLDLSDRIKQPQTKDRDIASIKKLVDVFKDDIKNKTKIKFYGKMQVYFYPEPQNPNINSLAQKLKVDCSKMKSSQKQQVYNTISKDFEKTLEKIYDLAKLDGTKNGYPGSDIWRFFKDDVVNFCIDRDPKYCNVLVILTDGYLYHKNTTGKSGNRTRDLETNTIKKYRNNISAMKKNNFGIECSRNDLDNLNVMVLGIDHTHGGHPDDFDILKYCWGKWFKEMNVGNFKGINESDYPIYKTDLPANTKKIIEDFCDGLPIK